MITKRNLLLQLIWTTLTFGLYLIYWFYATSREMTDQLRREEPVWLWTLLLIIPPLSFYSYYKHAEAFEIVSKESVSRWLILALWVFFPPAVWIVVQIKLNELARVVELKAQTGVQPESFKSTER